jgi:hypothetical protein
MPHITSSQFAERFVSLVLNGQAFPKKHLDRHILFISAIVKLDHGRQYSEFELNEELRKWITSFGTSLCVDHATLRRSLVDERYMKRDVAGSSYVLNMTDRSYTFDKSIESIDLFELVNEAGRVREERRRLHMRESKQ